MVSYKMCYDTIISSYGFLTDMRRNKIQMKRKKLKMIWLMVKIAGE